MMHFSQYFFFSIASFVPFSKGFCTQLIDAKINVRVAHNHQMGTRIFSKSGIDRRKIIFNSAFVGVASLISSTNQKANAIVDDSDLTKQMFNEDGSLKEGIIDGSIEAKDRFVNVGFPTSLSSNSALVSVDGSPLQASDHVTLNASYQVPTKWTNAPDYLDTLLSTREKACERIAMFQVPGFFKDFTLLEKASTIGIAKALGLGSIQSGVFPNSLSSADLINGRKVTKPASDDQDKNVRTYYQFDLAVAPDTCGNSAENLGLGFCPYDTIVLLSATIIDERMMVFGVSCTKDEWKRSNADLKRVRNSFLVGQADGSPS